MSFQQLLDAMPKKGSPLDWASVQALLGQRVGQMKNTVQDKIFHAEGDVWTHTKMCMQELVGSQEYWQMDRDNQFIVFYAMLTHDIAKPVCTKVDEDGRVSARGHSALGAIDARAFLYKHCVDTAIREQICNIISVHQEPFFLINKENFIHKAREISWRMDWNNLILVSKCDMLGRDYTQKQSVLDDVELCIEQVRQWGFLPQASYANEYTRWRYLNNPQTIDPQFSLHCDMSSGSSVKMMCALPGSGKDTYINTFYSDWEVVSLDEIRKELGVGWQDGSAEVARVAQERCKKLLAKHKNFIFNACNVQKSTREKWLSLFYQYNARVEIICIEKPWEQLVRDDKARDNVVGQKVIEQMMLGWSWPSIQEAEKITIIDTKTLAIKSKKRSLK